MPWNTDGVPPHLTDPELTVAPEVASYIGAEAVRRLLDRADRSRATCWDCTGPIAGEPAGAIVMRSHDSTREPDRVLLAHTACRPSGVYRLTGAELEKARQRWGIAAADLRGSSAQAEAGLLPLGGGRDRAVLIMAFLELFAVAPNGDRMDVATHYFLERGWNLIPRLGTPPSPPTADWRLTYQMVLEHRVTPGRLTLTGPDEIVAYWAEFYPPEVWLKELFDSRTCAVSVAPIEINPTSPVLSTHELQAAAKQGLAVGAMLTADFLTTKGRPAQALYSEVKTALNSQPSTPRRKRRR